MNQKFPTSMATAVCVVAVTMLTSCGGSSSGGTADPAVPFPVPDTITTVPELIGVGLGVVEEAFPGALESELVAVAGVPAVSGTNGVIQAAPGSTVEVGVTSHGGGLRYFLRLDSSNFGETIELRRSDETVDVSNPLGDFHNIGMRGSSSDGSEYYVSLFTDHEGGYDLYYVRGGFWLYVPTDATETAPSFGAFFDGSQPLREDDSFGARILGRGSATYSGKATGVCDCASASDTMVAPRVFEANAELIADFNFYGYSYSHAISGTITDFVVDGEVLTGDQSRVVSFLPRRPFLRDPPFGPLGFTSLDGGATNHGEWSADFYGEAPLSSDVFYDPRWIGGTFDASDSTETFVGAFGAHRISYVPASYAQFLRGGIATADTGQLRTALLAAGTGDGLITLFDDTNGFSVNQASVASTVMVHMPSINDDGDLVQYSWALEDSAGTDLTLYKQEWTLNARNSLGVFRNVAFDDAESSNDSAEYYVSLFTDQEALTIDTDYLSGGFWLYVPADATDSVSFGAFAYGNSPFSVNAFLGGGTSESVVTMATFSGKAAGICDCASASDTTVAPRVFEADAALTATFGPLDTISGTISDLIVDETDLGDASPTIFLQTATIAPLGRLDGGFFDGNTSLVSADDSVDAGNWGGTFYGDSSNDLPGSAGGTFGATAGGATYVGAFGAHLDQ